METLNRQFRQLVNGDTGRNMFGTPGTPHEIRNNFWFSFTKAFPETVTLDINGVMIQLIASRSESGKTTIYSAKLTNDQYMDILRSDAGLVKKKNIASLTLDNGRIRISGNGKSYRLVPNSDATIL